ncbi:MAG: SpaA isopeptide-forming pilin-related protein [Vallitalea sp.]|jgi:LPXTG-motif cell wall-anchored protein|nr:SpaA isopeptide-forming pilin-related protein [Vallitalea sp.]
MNKHINKVIYPLIVILLASNLMNFNVVTYAVSKDFYFSSVEVTYNGNDIESIPNNLSDGDLITLKLYWEITNEALVEKQILKTNLPEVFDWSTVAGGDLKGTGGKIYGFYEIVDEDTNGIYELKITFAKQSDLESNVTGMVGFKLKLSTKKTTIELPYTWTVPINTSDSKDIVFKVTPKGGKALTKSGAQESSNDIKWTIDFNTSLDSLTNPVLHDTYSSTLRYKDNSLTIHELRINGRGDIVLGNDVTGTALLELPTFNNAKASIKEGLGGNVDFKFKDITKAYRIEYITSIDPDKIDTAKTDFTYSNVIRLNDESAIPQVDVKISRGTLIEKTGFALDEYNIDYIDWEITVNNASYPLKSVRVEDILPDGLDLDTSSIKVVHKDNPSITLKENEDYILSTVPEENGLLVIKLGDINKEYSITYRTNILNSARLTDSKDSISFTNSATLYHELGSAIPKNGQPTVTVNLGKVVYKYGYGDIDYNDKKYINWELYVNMGEASLGVDKMIIDQLDDHQILDTAQGFQVEQLTLNHTNTFDTSVTKPSVIKNALSQLIDSTTLINESLDYTILYKKDDKEVNIKSDPTLDAVDKFELTFNNEVKSAYKISYRTIIVDKNQKTFNNSANIGSYNTNYVVRPTIANNYEKNRVGIGINYLDNSMSWQLKVNPVKEKVEGLTISDTISSNQYVTLADFQTFKVQKEGIDLSYSKEDTPGEDYYIDTVVETLTIRGVDTEVVRSFNIHFLDTVNEGNYTFNYKTYINPNTFGNNMNYTNTAIFDWTGNDSGPLKQVASPKLSSFAKNNGKKTGNPNFNSKSIDWEVYINYFSKTMNNVKMSDELPEGLLLKANSIEVYEYTIDGFGKVVEGSRADMSNIKIQESDDLKSFTVSFNGVHDKAYKIVYSTNLEGISKPKYSNTAKLTTGEKYGALVKYPVYDQFVSKKGSPNGTTSVDWTITINESRSEITNLKITDTLSQGLSPDMDSFAISNSDMKFKDYFDVIVQPKLLTTDPTVIVMTIKDGRIIDNKFNITYTTDIIEDEVIGKKINNSVAITGDQIDFGTKTDSYTEKYSHIVGFGVGTGEVGRFTLKKVDKHNHDIKLSGAEYEFRRGNKVLGTLTTDKNGEITVDNLLFLEHTLTETKAPEGYKLDRTPFVFKINSASKTFTLENEKIRTLKIIKVDKNNEDIVLPGASFEIYDDKDQIVDTVITDNTGVALINLDIGNYTVKEVKAPIGYYKDDEDKLVTIDTTKVLVEVTFKNTKISSTNPDPVPNPDPKPDVDHNSEPKPDDDPKPEPKPDEDPKPDKEPNSEPKPDKELNSELEPDSRPNVDTENTPNSLVKVVTKEDEPKSGELKVTDGTELVVDTHPKHGKVEINKKGKWLYTPEKDYVGKDTFSIKIKDSNGLEDTILFEIEMEEIPLGSMTLPQTGEGIHWLNYFLGGCIVLLGVVLYFKRR